jgi:hypothetical protein
MPVRRRTPWYGRRHRWIVVLLLALWLAALVFGPVVAYLVLAGM